MILGVEGRDCKFEDWLQNVLWIEYSGTPDYGDLAQEFSLRQGLLPWEVIMQTSWFFLGT